MFLPWALREGSRLPSTGASVVDSRVLGPVQVNATRSRRPEDAPTAGYVDPGDAVVWAFTTSGSIVTKAVSQVESVPGTLTIAQMSRVDGFRMTPDFRALSIRIDRRALPLTPREADTVARSSFSSRAGVPLLLGAMAGRVMRSELELGPTSRTVLARSMMDLTAAFLDDLLERHSPPQTITGSLVAAARQHIEEYANSPLLTPAEVADALAVSVRTLHKAFEGEETTVNRLILETRLARARALLERSGSDVTIERIALRSGFASLSSFSRAFRAHHGLSPRDWRQRAASS